MPSLYLVKFRQMLGASTHWAIFVPYESSPETADGLPGIGVLYHANKAWEACQALHLCNSGTTSFEIRKDYDLRESQSLLSSFRLHDTEVSHANVSAACDHVSMNRTFHYITQNCQDWVKDVIAYLVDKQIVSESVFEEMELQGYRTLSDSALVKCCQKSSFCWCRWKGKRR